AADIFTVAARDPISGLKGAVSGTLVPGETKVVRVVLQPSADVTGRALFADGRPADGIAAELIPLSGDGHGLASLFAGTQVDGRFTFTGVPIAPFRLELKDPLGSGFARRLGTATGEVSLGDIVLDEAPPTVTSTTPPASATGV